MTDRRPLPGTIEQQREGCVLAMLLCGEARGEQDAHGRLESVAMAAIYWTVRNRQRRPRWRALSLREIALQPWQFSCFNGNDPNREKLLDLWKSDPVSWERADTVLDLCEAGFPDPTGGATHYVALTLNGKPLWNSDAAPGQRVQWYHRSEIESGRTQEVSRHGSHVFATAP